MNTASTQAPAPILLLGDDLALDFVNTAYGVGEQHCDHLSSDKSVIAWLKTANVLPPEYVDAAPAGLLEAALALRESARQLIESRKKGSWADPALLNQILAFRQSHQELAWEDNAAPRLLSQHTDRHPHAVLAPVAQALAALLTTADFQLVRQCEGDHCTLLFHDLTKSHRRRWCSMAQCGNRMKVAAYRARQK